jgi:DMSO reductase family type II enzyme iron-sulfur subunit
MPKAPEVDRQLAAVFDTNKCLGCQTCSIACKTLWTDEPGMEYMWWNIVSTKPGRGTPRDIDQMGGGFAEDGSTLPGTLPTRETFGEAWDFNYDEVLGIQAEVDKEGLPSPSGGRGSTAFLHPKGGEPVWGANWEEDQGTGEYPNNYYFYVQFICNHCTRPACLEACPREAIYKRIDDGIVLIDEERCNGYRFCVEACPYKRIYFNHLRVIGQKCVFCFPRVEQGVAPACMRQCPGRLRFFGYLDDENSAVHKLVKKWKVALPYRPDWGTSPNVYYVPPLAPYRFDEQGDIDEENPRIPTEYLIQLFGPEVEDALATLREEMAKTRRGEQSELMDVLISYKWKDNFGGFDRDPAELDRPPVTT